jgi:outer membrane receptor protein involved in Fe transport
LYTQSPTTFTSANRFDTDERTDINVWASGALVQDKLFFFALFNPRDITQFDCGGGSCEEQTNDSPFYALKLDFVPADGHRLEYTFFSDDQTRDIKTWRWTDEANALIGDPATLQTATLAQLKGEQVVDSKYVNGGENHIFRYTASLTDWMTISAMYGENTYARQNFSDSEPPALLDRRSSTPGVNGTTLDIGTWSVFLFDVGEDTRENYRVDADFYFEMAGDHHVRVGWDQEDLKATTSNFYSGNLRARLEYSSTALVTGQRWRTRQYYNDGGFETQQSAWYIQDSWQIGDNFTLNLGLRNETFDNMNLFGETFVETKDQLAPRVGFSWDPTGDGTNRIYGSFGEYYLPIATNTNMRLAGQEVYFQEYFESVDANADGQPDYDANGFPLFGVAIGGRGY